MTAILHLIQHLSATRFRVNVPGSEKAVPLSFDSFIRKGSNFSVLSGNKIYRIFPEERLLDDVLVEPFHLLSDPRDLESELLDDDEDQRLEEEDVGHVLHERSEHGADARLV